MLIDMQAAGAGPLAMAFMMTRKIVFSQDEIKGQRKAARHMLEKHVEPKHVIQATQELMAAKDKRGNPLTIVDLFSIMDTAVAIANPAPVQADSRTALPSFVDGKPVVK